MIITNAVSALSNMSTHLVDIRWAKALGFFDPSSGEWDASKGGLEGYLARRQERRANNAAATAAAREQRARCMGGRARGGGHGWRRQEQMAFAASREVGISGEAVEGKEFFGGDGIGPDGFIEVGVGGVAYLGRASWGWEEVEGGGWMSEEAELWAFATTLGGAFCALPQVRRWCAERRAEAMSLNER
jgi:hypothetical protein